jgi:hypothetical protein
VNLRRRKSRLAAAALIFGNLKMISLSWLFVTIWLLPLHIPFSLQYVRLATQRQTEKGRQLADGRGGMGEELNHTTARKSSLLYSKSLNYLCRTFSESSLSGLTIVRRLSNAETLHTRRGREVQINFFI